MSPSHEMSQPYRLAHGGLIERDRPLSFVFDGRRFVGFGGDTLASALIANGIRLVARSFKYHRPRGIMTAGPEEPNALVELRTGARREPNTRATTAELFDGLVATSQNRWPSLDLDIMAINSLLAPLLGAGFYYKTFMWPASFWEKVYEPLIRRAAGLGRAAGVDDPDHYEKSHLFCDVLVVGAGPAGLMAALAAGRAGARVVLCEDDVRLGGRLLSDRRVLDARPGAAWVADIEAELEALPNVRILRRSAVVAVHDGSMYTAIERVNDHVAEPPQYEVRQRLWHISAKRAVLTAGAVERPLVFPGNDRPGVMMAAAVRTYVNRFAVAPGRRAIVFASHDEAASTAIDLIAAGVEVVAFVDPRDDPAPTLESLLASHGIRRIRGGVVARVHGTRGVAAASIRLASGETKRIACDLVCMSAGWNPCVQLASHLGGKPVWDEAIGAFVAGNTPAGMSVAGAASGALTLADALAAGARVGLAAAGDCGHRGQPVITPKVDDEGSRGRPLWRVNGERGKAFVDFQNDVTDKDVELAHREGFRRVEHLKRYTTLGMATDQGKTSGTNGLALMAELTARSVPQTGVTRDRPPSCPVAIGALAGHHRGKEFRPTRLPPSHQWAKEQGAVFVETGQWLRAQWYPRASETEWLESVSREVRSVRAAVGVCDVSTLGKIDVQGRDALAFLERIYCNGLATLAVGRARYGLMLREDGFVMDDGTAARIGAERYVVTTTTANALRVMQHMEFCRQWLWPDLDVQIVSVSDQWAQYAVAGPRSRELLARVVDQPAAIANEVFPYLAAGELTILSGLPARLFRLSFSGELAYELAVPSGWGDLVIRRLMEAGEDLGVTPYGTEALGVMRIEKGHVAGNEINGHTTAGDLGLGRMLSKSKDYVGRAMAGRVGLVDPGRPSLVGLRPVDGSERLRAGAHFVPDGRAPTAANDEGYMTSVAYSPSLGHWIGLGLLSGGAGRHGQLIRAADPMRGTSTLVEVCNPVFFDRSGMRLRG